KTECTDECKEGIGPEESRITVYKQYGVDIANQIAQHFTAALYDKYERIFVMDIQNYADVIRLAKNEEQRAKVSLFLDDDIVPDPYYDDAMFEPVYAMVEERCQELILQLSK